MWTIILLVWGSLLSGFALGAWWAGINRHTRCEECVGRINEYLLNHGVRLPL
jgi:hypothetical protein